MRIDPREFSPASPNPSLIKLVVRAHLFHSKLMKQGRGKYSQLAKGEELKEELLAHPDVRAWLATMWSEIKRTLITTSSDPTSELRTRLDNGLVQFGEKLCTDPELKRKIDTWVERAVAHVVDNYRNEVSDLIASTVERWDADATSRKMELQVGRDLQFIRINGTLVGGLAGLAIHTIGEVFF